ncbi:hypothetical protein HNO88_002771 [Novosphingobium chloroacetimidivorans]|uniref:HNH nuclease domain-containing protein n=2 Tax=Novosphingobium chloroacetimidivorans TaxID=1428314 RepID=A0A7W7KAV7_9SPHN|nr:hypothetical protein [Novosphingobium chloroacetimidivorans]
MDHINGDRGDNRWCNLRPCSRSENLQNRVGFAKSGHKLIVISKTPRGHTRYYCRIGRNGRTINSPTFYDLEAALAWRDEWLRCNGTAFTNTSHINDLTN